MRYLLYTRPRLGSFAVHDTLLGTWSRYCSSIKLASLHYKEYTVSAYDATADIYPPTYYLTSSDTPHFTPEDFPELYI